MNKAKSGFEYIKEYDFGSCKADEYRHNSGAELIYINSDCNEKSFGVFFKTVPDDSTGVFHILEHSLVSGSDKYPIRSPFLYMMKNSMATYLNAVTFQGKTGYLCASCNGKDFDNLMSVCLDAAFKPLLKRETFEREGWNLSAKDGARSIGGVVFNEMCGAMSSMDMQMYSGARKDLFPDTYQRYISGGNPSEITELTYDDFLKTYKEFYRADGCVIFLSGNLNIEAALKTIDEYLCLCPSDGKSHEYSLQSPKISKTERDVFVPYQPKGTCNAVLSYCIGDYGDEMTFITADIVLNCLLGDNSSPLKKELLESGLVGDVYWGFFTERQLGANISLYNVKDGKIDEVSKIIRKHFFEFKTENYKTQIEAILARKKFETEESITAFPRQAIHNFATLADNIFYGLPLNCYYKAKILTEIENRLEDKYIERLIERFFIKNNHYAQSVFKPVYGATDYIKNALRNLQDSEADEIAASCREEPNEAPMPVVKKEELERKLVRLKSEVSGAEIITKANTANINYERFYFNASDFNEDELSVLGFLCAALSKFPTHGFGADKLADGIKRYIGRLNFNTVVTDNGETYLRVSVAYLKPYRENAIALLREIFGSTVFNREETDKLIIREKFAKERSFAANPMPLAVNGSQVPLSDAATNRYYTSGYGYYNFLKKFENAPEKLCSLLVRVGKKLFVGARLIKGATGINPSALNLPMGKGAVRKIIERKCGGFAYSVPVAVNYNAKAFKLDIPVTGKLNVVSRILTYGHLWREVREKGNAYGASFFFNNDGTCVANSFRDPSVSKTYSVFDDCADYLIRTNFDKDVDGYIVGAATEFIKPLSIEDESMRNELDILCGKPSDFAQKRFDEVLSFSPQDVVTYGEVLKNASEVNLCSAGGQAIDESGLFTEVIKIGG